MSDYISRSAAIKSIRECIEAADANGEYEMMVGYRNAIECLEEEASVDVRENIYGKWFECAGGNDHVF